MTGRPAFWVWAVGCALGAYTTLITIVPQAGVFSSGALIGLVVLVPLLLVGFWLFHRIRPVRSNPVRYALMAVAWGGFGAFGVAFAANTAFLSLLRKTVGLEFADRWGNTIVAPIDEELAKVAGVALLALMVPHLISGPLAGFGYGALAGLGFQVVENFLYVFNTITAAGGVHEVSDSLSSLFVRVVLSAWWSHWAMTAVSGAALGYLLGRVCRPMPRRVLVGAGGLALAMLMHAWWDSPTLAGAFLIKALPLLLVALIVFLLARHNERHRVPCTAQAEVQEAA
ncbi:PrsW family intramembrane metalloprotease [Acrocarpospora sp. B8E8]|uniref:PrsW family intramembrane metalloprotease n=1 Tax=Acrocarpospora sp. B8E8 TaxID=3153572 RepID=UPI00325E590C